MGTPSTYSPEVRERAVRLVQEHEHPSAVGYDLFGGGEDRLFGGVPADPGSPTGAGCPPASGFDDR